ncbi:MAG: ABC transporter ATP-binding protein [Clostridiales bacterium]|nr:ABC transporter ATP-binding protein [Clostridiales bacterium]
MKSKIKEKKGALWALCQMVMDLSAVWGWLVLIFFCAVGVIVCNVISPKLVGRLVGALSDYSLYGGDAATFLNGLKEPIWWLLLVYACYALFSFLKAFLINHTTTNRITAGKRIQLSDKISRLPLSYLDKTTIGEMLSRVHNNVGTMGWNINQTIDVTIMGGLQIIVMTVMMLSEHTLIATIVLLLTPLSAVISTVIAKTSAKEYDKLWNEYDKLYAFAEETYGGLETVKSFGMERGRQETYLQISERLSKISKKANFLSALVQPVVGFVNHLSFIVVCLLGGYLSVKGEMDVGTVVTLVLYSKNFSTPLMLIANGFSSVQLLGSSAKKVYEFLEEKEMSVETGSFASAVEGNVCFDDVHFGYVEGKEVLKGLSLDALAGQKIAVVGPTGGGKTTLVNLLMRFYEPQKGKIYIDGQDIAQMNREVLRENISMVLQDTWLFEGSVAENIAYGKAGATREDVERAAKSAYADAFISLLPNGYDTVLSERTALSGGQKQLLTIARAFLSDKPILILDEATSDVDTRTEIYIQKAMDKLQKNRTCFIIAHRLSTIVHADKILAIDKGEIVDVGKHEELLKKGGFYAELWKSQYANLS